MAEILHQAHDYLLLALGLGFVIFFHELGHFLAAKYCDVKVEQFAVGFGPAIIAWRKGIGFCWGSTTPAMNKVVEENFDTAQKENLQTREALSPSSDQAAAITKRLGLGETEYRLNWIPLGGYVKMLGQDDLRPGMTAEDPRAYNKKSVGARMIIVSAGVIMNVILAAVGFMIVFMIGYPVPPATVGNVVASSPASRAATANGVAVGLQTGDVLISYNGTEMGRDFSRIPLHVALTHDGERIPIVVQHVDGTQETLYATPERPDGEGKGLLQLGVGQPFSLAGPEPSTPDDDDPAMLRRTQLADVFALDSGDTITEIAGAPKNPDGNAAMAQLYKALENAGGKPVPLTVTSAAGAVRHISILPHFSEPFSGTDLSFLGLVPRATVAGLVDQSPALDKIKPGDAIVTVDVGTDHLQNPSCQQVHDTLTAAGEKGLQITLAVLDPDAKAPRTIENLTPIRLPHGGGRSGLGISLGTDEQHLVVAEVQPNSPAKAAKIPAGATILALNGKPVNNWFDLRSVIIAASVGEKLSVTYVSPDSDDKPVVTSIPLTKADIDSIRQITLTQYLPLHPMPSPLTTGNPILALGRGIGTTRDLILQFYVTLMRMRTGEVGLSNVMGPFGMAHEGAQVASRGTAWLIWFLCLISANLAVVNFLPIPIVDGGLFTMLILEKIMGKPLSPDVQRIVQVVGLVLILGVFLLVTYQDFARMAGY